MKTLKKGNPMPEFYKGECFYCGAEYLATSEEVAEICINNRTDLVLKRGDCYYNFKGKTPCYNCCMTVTLYPVKKEDIDPEPSSIEYTEDGHSYVKPSEKKAKPTVKHDITVGSDQKEYPYKESKATSKVVGTVAEVPSEEQLAEAFGNLAFLAHTDKDIKEFNNRIYKEAFAVYGGDNQILKTIEECTELNLALMHFLDDRTDEENVILEIADVEIMIEQLRLIFNNRKINEAKDFKLKRLKKRLEDGEL